MANQFLGNYLESIESVPGELQRNFTLMQDLDQRVYDLMKEVDECYSTYIEGVGSMETKDKARCLSDIRKKFDKSNAYSDDKVQLAMQTYEMVDKHIRRLDSDLQKLEADQRSKDNSESSSRMFVDKSDPKSSKKKKKRGSSALDDHNNQAQPTMPFSMITASGDGLDMPVDPNEPTYCLCHQVSYGEMIGCDNGDCPVEWFHFACVGLASKPKGNWYCPQCAKNSK